MSFARTSKETVSCCQFFCDTRQNSAGAPHCTPAHHRIFYSKKKLNKNDGEFFFGDAKGVLFFWTSLTNAMLNFFCHTIESGYPEEESSYSIVFQKISLIRQ